MSAAKVRLALQDAKRIVVKIGSKALIDPAAFAAFGKAINALHREGREIVLVSSGAIALGRARLGLEIRPQDIGRLQACAAAGQAALMQSWEDAFADRIPVAQVLLTHADLADRERYLNARSALEAMLELGCLPIINENDTVSVREIRFGDNDQLAAMVATLVGADLLVLLSGIEGLLDLDGKRVPIVAEVQEAASFVQDRADGIGTGGMTSKLEAARQATAHGVPMLIADSRRPEQLPALLAGEDFGTLFLPKGAKLPSRKHWIAFTLKPQGEVLVDAGAASALRRGASLLMAGVLGVRGTFQSGELVLLVGPEGEIGRGLARYEVGEAARLAGNRQGTIEAKLGRKADPVLVHRDDMVLGEH